jgi:nucleoside-diphosphate-sugar epimerase
MKLLVIGGTRFVGRHLVDAALARGHEVTLFNRGRSNADLFPKVEKLVGDRETDLSALDGRRWDAVIDTCGYVPRVVDLSVKKLAEAVERYLFISTISAYVNPTRPGEDENALLQGLQDPLVEEVTADTYGGLKVLCEHLVKHHFHDRALAVRPGIVVGPEDTTDRYTYWVERMARGGEVLVPGDPDRPVQMIDARDLGAFMIGLLEQGASGAFNATGPDQPLTWQQWMESLIAAAGSSPSLTWIEDVFLQERDATGGELPFWVPDAYKHIFSISSERARQAGLTFRPPVDTARDTLAWSQARSDTRRKAGMKPEREADLLAAWNNRHA